MNMRFAAWVSDGAKRHPLYEGKSATEARRICSVVSGAMYMFGPSGLTVYVEQLDANGMVIGRVYDHRMLPELICQGKRDCSGAVTHIDHKGWIYCSPCAAGFRYDRPVRALRPWEIAVLRTGRPIVYERISRALFYQKHMKGAN